MWRVSAISPLHILFYLKKTWSFFWYKQYFACHDTYFKLFAHYIMLPAFYNIWTWFKVWSLVSFVVHLHSRATFSCHSKITVCKTIIVWIGLGARINWSGLRKDQGWGENELTYIRCITLHFILPTVGKPALILVDYASVCTVVYRLCFIDIFDTGYTFIIL